MTSDFNERKVFGQKCQQLTYNPTFNVLWFRTLGLFNAAGSEKHTFHILSLNHFQAAHIQPVLCSNENRLQSWFSGQTWLWFCTLWLQHCSTRTSCCPERERGSCRMNWKLWPLDSTTRSSWTWSSGWNRTSSSARSTSNRSTEYESLSKKGIISLS